jgi:hypothetical protein
MTRDEHRGDRGPFFRAALSVLAAVILAGTATELAIDRHWQDVEQLIPWGCLVVAGAALALLSARPSPRRVWLSRGLATLVLVFAAVGVWRHVAANYDTAPLDQEFEARWGQMPELQRWWAASSGAVGPAPPLAPGVLGQAAVCILLASVGAASPDCRLDRA